MVATINASVSSSGIVSTADGSGILKVQSNGVATNSLVWCNYAGGSTTAAVSVASTVTSIVTPVASNGIYLNSTTVSANTSHGFAFNPTGVMTNVGTDFSFTDVTVANNNTAAAAGNHEMSFYGFFGTLAMTRVTVTSTANTAGNKGSGISFVGQTAPAPAAYVAADAMTLTDVTVSGVNYGKGGNSRGALSFKSYSDLSKVTMSGVDLTGSTIRSGQTSSSFARR